MTSAASGLPGFDMPHTGKKNKRILKDNSSNKNKRLMIDFDGVIHSYHKGYLDGEIYGYVIDDAKEVIDELKNDFEIVIFTSRLSNENSNNQSEKRKIEDWLKENKIHYDYITSDKLAAEYYIDDKAITFNNNWSDILNKIKN